MFPTLTTMTVLQVLSEMICTEEFLCLIAFTELVLRYKMLLPLIPIGRRFVCKLVATVATNIKRGDAVCGVARWLLLLAGAGVGGWY